MTKILQGCCAPPEFFSGGAAAPPLPTGLHHTMAADHLQLQDPPLEQPPTIPSPDPFTRKV